MLKYIAYAECHSFIFLMPDELCSKVDMDLLDSAMDSARGVCREVMDSALGVCTEV